MIKRYHYISCFLIRDLGERVEEREREREKKMADLSHHHADKLVEVHGPASVLVDLLYDVVEVVLCKCTVNLTEDFFKNLKLRKYIIYMFLIKKKPGPNNCSYNLKTLR